MHDLQVTTTITETLSGDKHATPGDTINRLLDRAKEFAGKDFVSAAVRFGLDEFKVSAKIEPRWPHERR